MASYGRADANFYVPVDVTIEEVTGDDLPRWDSPDKAASQAFGSRWYDERRSLILLVPSMHGSLR